MKNNFNLNILLVDDDVNICRTLTLSLQDLGCSVTQSNSVNDALSQLRKNQFDLVLTDYRMDSKTGMDLITESRPFTSTTVFVVMTAYASFENAVAVVREGAFDYLPKPFTTGQLTHLLQRVRLLVSLRQENEELKKAKAEETTSPA